LDEFTLNERSRLPLYAQIEAHVLQLVHSRRLRPGHMLPSEHDMARAYGVSRLTIRQAIGRLVDQGVLIRQRGKGTFVNQPRVSQSLTHLWGFTEDMVARRRVASSIVLRRERVKAPPAVTEALQQAPDALTVCVERLRQADGTPMAFERAYLAFPGCEKLLDEDLSGSLYQLLRTRYGIVPTCAEQHVDAGVAKRPEQAMLELPPGSPVFEIRRLTYGQNGKPFEYVESIYRGDQFTLSARLDLRGSTPLALDHRDRRQPRSARHTKPQEVTPIDPTTP
jgi:GntR family transcriptional regulator